MLAASRLVLAIDIGALLASQSRREASNIAVDRVEIGAARVVTTLQ